VYAVREPINQATVFTDFRHGLGRGMWSSATVSSTHIRNQYHVVRRAKRDVEDEIHIEEVSGDGFRDRRQYTPNDFDDAP
jgi:hypothetical protein